MTTLISIVNNLNNGQGHVHAYHMAVAKAAELNGWRHIAFCSIDDKNFPLPKNWFPCLFTGALKTGIRSEFKKLRIIYIFKSIFKYTRGLRKSITEERLTIPDDKIIFLESFNAFQLLSLTTALFFSQRKKISCWLLYRHKHNYNKLFSINSMICKWLNRLLNSFLGPKFKLLTDSELLRDTLGKYFAMTLTTLPVPHAFELEEYTEYDNHRITIDTDRQIICWWPGPSRETKGWDIIRKISQHISPEATQFTLIATESSGLTQTEGGINIYLTHNILKQDEYLHFLKISKIILLPYNKTIYAQSTSGVFTESIVAGKIVIVSDDTWMAHELKKYDLNELIFDWDKTKLFKLLISIIENKNIERKIEIMKTNYKPLHSVTSYALTIKSLYTNRPFHRNLKQIAKRS